MYNLIDLLGVDCSHVELNVAHERLIKDNGPGLSLFVLVIRRTMFLMIYIKHVFKDAPGVVVLD